MTDDLDSLGLLILGIALIVIGTALATFFICRMLWLP